MRLTFSQRKDAMYQAIRLRAALIVTVVLSWPTLPAARATVIVRVQPATQTVALGSLLKVTLVADIPNPVVGWGFDLNASQPGVLTNAGAPAIASPPWVPVATPDGDGLAGLAT